jgi:hypothetical protein
MLNAWPSTPRPMPLDFDAEAHALRAINYAETKLRTL